MDDCYLARMCCNLLLRKDGLAIECLCKCHCVYQSLKIQKKNCLLPTDRYIDICQFCNSQKCKCCQICIPKGFIICQC